VTAEEVVARRPDLIIGSWCGKKFRPERVVERPDFDRIPAVKHQEVYEIKSSLILQPGPAALTDGLAEFRELLSGGQIVEARVLFHSPLTSRLFFWERLDAVDRFCPM
jgi:iron complex transport system substrate-binding protein